MTKSMHMTLASLILVALGPLAALAQTADEIVEKSIAARGGAQRLKAVHSERVTGRIISGRHGKSRFVVELKRPGKMRMELTEAGRTITRIYDGQSGGWILNPIGGKADPVPMTINEIKNIQKEADFDGPLVDYKVHETQIELIGKEIINGRNVFKLRVAPKGNDVLYYYFDAASFLLIKWEGTRIDNGKETVVESFFREYRDVQQLKIAFEIISRTPGTNLRQKIILEKVDLNPLLDDSRFSKPDTEG